MLPTDGGICAEATGRRQANHMSFQSWSCHFIVGYKVRIWNRGCSVGGGKCYNTHHILLTSVHVTMFWLPHWSRHCMANYLQTQRTFKQQLGARWHRLACHVTLMVFTAFPIVHCEPYTSLGTTLNLFRVFKSSWCCRFCSIFTVYSTVKWWNNYWKRVWFTCLLPVAPAHIPPSDGNIY